MSGRVDETKKETLQNDAEQALSAIGEGLVKQSR